MTERTFFTGLIIAWFILAAATFIALFFVTAPYGRHIRQGWGPTLPNGLGWVLMEAPAAFVMALCFVLGPHRNTASAWLFLAMWEAHYVHRAFVYPWSLRDRGKRMPFSVAGMALLFNLVNGYLNGRWLFALSGGYSAAWLRDWRFLAGLALFAAGFVINRRADHTLRCMRRTGETGYAIPRGGLYRWISCPNYFGEIVEWAGWALATWSIAGLAFAVWTAANLAPRAWPTTAGIMPDFPTIRRSAERWCRGCGEIEGDPAACIDRLPFSAAVCLTVILLLPPAVMAAPAAPAITVYYAGPDDSVRTALMLAGVRIVTDPADARVLVLNDAAPNPAALARRVRAGAGLLLILGPHISAAAAGTLLGQAVTLTPASDPLSLDRAPGAVDPLVSEILWNSTPQVRERSVITGIALEPLVAGFGTDEVALGRMSLGTTTVFLLTPNLGDANPQLQQWAYFNYLVYHLVARAAGETPLSFAAIRPRRCRTPVIGRCCSACSG